MIYENILQHFYITNRIKIYSEKENRVSHSVENSDLYL